MDHWRIRLHRRSGFIGESSKTGNGKVDERSNDMEEALTLEELRMETTELLPDRLVMGSFCQPKCGDGCDSFALTLKVDVCISLGCK
jgi:hypothetical protein